MESIEQKQTFIKSLLEKKTLSLNELMEIKALIENLTEDEKTQLDKESLKHILQYNS